MKTKSCHVKFGVGKMHYELDLPAGLQVRPVLTGTEGFNGNYNLDQFPVSIFPFNSFVRHDATHYGIVLTPDQVTE